MTLENPRKADNSVTPMFIERWSPRSFTGEDMPEAALLRVLEAARWAPSSYNSQPWRFLYAKRNTPQFEKFLGLLNATNQVWAQRASVLMILVSKKTMRLPNATADRPARDHSFDAGAAWGYLALEASLTGWAAHAMAGFDAEKARTELAVPEEYNVEVAIALGKRGDKKQLPDGLQAIESPNDRSPLSETAIEGGFKK